MFVKNVLFAIPISIGFVGWGIIGKYSQAHACWVGFLVSIATTFTLLGIYSTRYFSGLPDKKALMILFVAGVVNGFAVWLYSIRVTDQTLTELEVAAFVTIVYIAMIMMTPVINLVINNVSPTLNHAIGYGLAVAAVFFLSK